MTLTEFVHWQAFLRDNPPEAPADARTDAVLRHLTESVASLMATIMNMAGKTLPKGKTVRPSDFRPRPPQTAEQQLAFMRQLGTGKANA